VSELELNIHLDVPDEEKVRARLEKPRLRGLRSLGQPDVCLRKATKDDGFEYYEMLFVYVDDIRTLIIAQITADSKKVELHDDRENRRIAADTSLSSLLSDC
jgi:hypothetical protein